MKLTAGLALVVSIVQTVRDVHSATLRISSGSARQARVSASTRPPEKAFLTSRGNQSAAATTDRLEKKQQEASSHNILCYLKQCCSTGSNYLLQNNRCAVISSSGALLHRTLGTDINMHQAVMRFNGAPTAGYENHVGSKTTVMVYESDIVGRERHRLALRNMYPNQNGYRAASDDPTTGFYGMLLALSNCAAVDAYEMASSPAQHWAPYSYYNKELGKIRAKNNSWHGFFRAEHDLWSKASTIDTNGGKASFPGFSQLTCSGYIEPPLLNQTVR